MANSANAAKCAFVWNAGGWFGTQVGGTLWLLILGFVLAPKDALAGCAGVASFFALNAWGLYLWHCRARLSAYGGLQRFLIVASVVIALVVWVVNTRGLFVPSTPDDWRSTYLPYWVIAVAPAVMLLFFLFERIATRARDDVARPRV